jgi:hypothetical protein
MRLPLLPWAYDLPIGTEQFRDCAATSYDESLSGVMRDMSERLQSDPGLGERERNDDASIGVDSQPDFR